MNLSPDPTASKIQSNFHCSKSRSGSLLFFIYSPCLMAWEEDA